MDRYEEARRFLEGIGLVNDREIKVVRFIEQALKNDDWRNVLLKAKYEQRDNCEYKSGDWFYYDSQIEVLEECEVE